MSDVSEKLSNLPRKAWMVYLAKKEMRKGEKWEGDLPLVTRQDLITYPRLGIVIRAFQLDLCIHPMTKKKFSLHRVLLGETYHIG
jgi:hypothetical protein